MFGQPDKHELSMNWYRTKIFQTQFLFHKRATYSNRMQRNQNVKDSDFYSPRPMDEAERHVSF